ncbi:MAG: hypothetical protein ACPG5T_09620, partial [Endozoicomonas sp.]
GSFFLVNGQPFKPSQTRILKPVIGPASFGIEIPGRCKRVVGGACALQFIELDKPGERRVIDVSSDDVSVTDPVSRFQSIELVEFQESLYWVLEHSGETSIKGVKTEGITSVVEAWQRFKSSQPLRESSYELSAGALKTAITVLVERESGHIFQQIDGEDKAVQFVGQDGVFRIFSGTGVVTDLVKSDQSSGGEGSQPFGVSVDPQSEWLLLYDKDTGVSAGETLKAVDVAEKYVAEVDSPLKMVEASKGAVGVAAAHPDFQKGGKYYSFTERFINVLNSFFEENETGKSLVRYLEQQGDRVAHPAQLKGLDPSLGDGAYPEGLKLVLTLEPPDPEAPERVPGNRIRPYDSEAAAGTKPLTKGSATQLYIDPTMDWAWGNMNFYSRFSEAALDILDASS